MDISQFDSIKTNAKKLELEDPNGQPLLYDTGETEDSETELEECTTDGGIDVSRPVQVPVRAAVTITLVSSDSPEYTTVYKAQVTETIGRVGKRGKSKHNVTGETVAADKLALLVACTKAWTGWQDNGKDFPFSKKNALSLYERLPFVREQVDE